MAKKRTLPQKSALKAPGLTFENLALFISGVDQELASHASRAVNISLTLRNWLIGCYIAEYELRGADRAQYGEKLLAKLSGRLIENGVSRPEERELRRYRQFYQRPERELAPLASPRVSPIFRVLLRSTCVDRVISLPRRVPGEADAWRSPPEGQDPSPLRHSGPSGGFAGPRPARPQATREFFPVGMGLPADS
jgi:hypothetical protein